jgi:hypothetical protein
MWYHLIFSDNKKAVGYAWNLMGFVAKLAQGVCTMLCHLDFIDAVPSARFAYVMPTERET